MLAETQMQGGSPYQAEPRKLRRRPSAGRKKAMPQAGLVAQVDGDLHGALEVDAQAIVSRLGGTEGVGVGGHAGADGRAGDAVDGAHLDTVDGAVAVLSHDGGDISGGPAGGVVNKVELGPGAQDGAVGVGQQAGAVREARSSALGAILGGEVDGGVRGEGKGEVRAGAGVPAGDGAGAGGLVPVVAGHGRRRVGEADGVGVQRGDVRVSDDEEVAAVAVAAGVSDLGNLLLGGARRDAGDVVEGRVGGHEVAGGVNAAGAGAGAGRLGRRRRRGRSCERGRSKVDIDIDSSSRRHSGNSAAGGRAAGGVVVVALLSPADVFAVDGGADLVAVGTLVLVGVAMAVGGVDRRSSGAEEQERGETSHFEL